jgi:hypothetical protein
MNGVKTQIRQADQSRTQKQVELPQQQNDLHEAVARAFEVAQRIGKTVCPGHDETLEQFIFRAMTSLLGRRDGTNFQIGLAADMNTWSYGPLQVHDASEKGPAFRSFSENELNSYQSGHPIYLTVWVKSENETSAVCQYLKKDGFLKGEMDRPNLPGFLYSKCRDKSELNPHLLTNLLCSILKNILGVKIRKELVCYFPDEIESSTLKLDSEENLRQCLALILSRQPKNTVLDIGSSKDGERFFTMELATHTTLRIRVWADFADTKGRSKIESLIEAAGYAKDTGYGNDFWLGSSDIQTVIPLILNTLHAAGINLKLDSVGIVLYLIKRFG